MKNAIILCLLAAAIVSAQPKQRVAVLPSVGDLDDPQELILLTDKVREIATKHLPMENFNILKQDVITKLIGEEELYKACKEGVCIGDLARKTNANYGARADVIKLRDRLVLKFELYSVNEDAIFETFTDYNVKDFYGMLPVLEARLPDVFRKMAIAYKAELAKAVPPPEPPKAYLPPEPPKVQLPPKPPKQTPVTAVPTPAVTTFVDSRDGKTYKKVTIGNQTWMAENLDYDDPVRSSDVCYDNDATNCEKYGRLYNWDTAMQACPAGWHLPSDAEWKTLENAVGGSKKAGTKLKSTSSVDWKYKKGRIGTDEYGFSALPGGLSQKVCKRSSRC